MLPGAGEPRGVDRAVDRGLEPDLVAHQRARAQSAGVQVPDVRGETPGEGPVLAAVVARQLPLARELEGAEVDQLVELALEAREVELRRQGDAPLGVEAPLAAGLEEGRT